MTHVSHGASSPDTERLHLLADIAPGLVHDIRNRLNIVLGTTEIARRRISAAAEKLDVIDTAVRGANVLIDTLMRVVSLGAEPAAPQVVDVNARLLALMPLLQSILSPKTILRYRLVTGGPLPIPADTDAFDSAILNLATNARDALHPFDGGAVTIRTRHHSAIGLDGAPAGYVQISVGDDGAGMDKHTLARASEAFFTTKGAYGCGLGLHQARRFAESAGGRMRIRSAPDIGTIIHLWLPCASARDASAPGTDRIRISHTTVQTGGENQQDWLT